MPPNRYQDSGSVGPAINSSLSRNIPQLNDDVVFLIIEHLYYDPTLLPDWENFPRYALVARSWRIPVQVLLFHEVKITSTDANYEALRKAVDPSTEHGRLLRSSVRILNYTLSPGSATIPTYKATTWEKRLPVALKLFPYLYELRLNVDALDSLSPSVIRALDRTPPIRALQIGMRHHPYRTVGQSNVPLQLLHIPSWPLEAIVFRGERWAVQDFSNFPPVEHQLYEVRWLCPEPRVGSLEPFLKYLTSNSSKSLQILHVPRVGHILPEWAPALRSVLLTGADPSILQQLPQLPFLRELVIAETGTPPIDVETQVAALATLPPKLEHLGFAMARDKVTLSTLKNALVSMPQTLRVLSIYSPPISVVPRIAAQANARKAVELIGSQQNFPDVSIHLYDDPVLSRVGQRSDLIKTNNFPRGVSIANMRYMTDIVTEREVKGESLISRLLGKTTRKAKQRLTGTRSDLNIVATARDEVA